MSSNSDLFQLPVTQPKLTTRIRNYLNSQHEISIKTSDHEFSYEYLGIRSDFGPPFTTIDHGDVYLFHDLKKLYGCDPYSRKDSKIIKNKILLVSRGGQCTFIEKVLHAQKAGAKAVIFLNNQHGDIRIVGTAKTPVRIPSMIISHQDTLSLLKTRKKPLATFQVHPLPPIDLDPQAVISLLYRGERIQNVVIVNV
ncbi:uncharacterized protein EV154DRAFT_414409 [Mucor mucedo]|uniref:uncharacterized protein n=1 Tax=Mucor mucedo TaxID=29922 RepID=UPI00221F949E|nr:uncharacterized protein EV154DRAFT_414409 [Mucor mucedo]KAI7894933.1 hypothetical protein EV154DRAFT_414409 [Mucor mucedo]